MLNFPLVEKSELFGAGPFAKMSSEELVSEWYIRFKVGAGGSNGVVVEYHKLDYDREVMWQSKEPPMDQMERDLYVTVDDKGEQTRAREAREPGYKVIPRIYDCGLCTIEQAEEFRVLTSVKFDQCLQRALSGVEPRYRCRIGMKLDRRMDLYPSESVTRRMEIYKYEDAFDGSQHIYPDGTMFTHDKEWCVRQDVCDLAHARIIAQTVCIKRMLDIDPTVVLFPEFQACLTKCAATVFHRF